MKPITVPFNDFFQIKYRFGSLVFAYKTINYLGLCNYTKDGVKHDFILSIVLRLHFQKNI